MRLLINIPSFAHIMPMAHEKLTVMKLLCLEESFMKNIFAFLILHATDWELQMILQFDFV